MADARTIIDGRLVTEARYNTTDNGNKVANLRIMAGRSKKNDQGGYDTITDTAYDVAFWGDHAALVNALNPQVGDTVIAHGTIVGLEAYDGKNGLSLSAKVTGDGLRVFPKRDQQGGYQQQGGGGYQQAQPQQGQPSYSQAQQADGWGQPPQGDPWNAPQGDRPPF